MMGIRFTVRLLSLALAGSCVAAAMALAAPAQAATASHLWAWGYGDGGQLGIGSAGVRIAPVAVHGLGTSAVRQVVAPNLFGPVVALTADGRVWAWGPGPLGNGSSSSTGSDSPVQLTSLPGTVAIAATMQGNSGALYNTFYALRSDGTVWAWGYGLQGQLGNGAFANSSVPVQVTGITSPVISVVSGQYQASGQNSIVAIGTDGSLWSWGYSGFGATGSGGSGASPGRVPRVPAAHAAFTIEGSTWFAAV